MSVKIKFISVVVPIENINTSSFVGGFSGYLDQFSAARGKSFWHDNHFLVEWAMNPMDIQELVERWESFGLISRIETDGVRQWKDLCVVDFYQGLSLPCDWLIYDRQDHVAHKIGNASTEVVGPDFSGDDKPLFINTSDMNEFAKYAVQKHLKAKKPWWRLW